MAQIKRTLVIITEQKINPDKSSGVEGYSMRDWNIELFLASTENPDELVRADCFEKVTYHLHETFGKRAKQPKTTPPFRVQEEGWGEFDMRIIPTQVGKGDLDVVGHDLNFQQERYESRHEVTFKNPKPELLAILRSSGPVPEGNGAAAGKPEKRKRANKNVDMEKLAEGLGKLDEDSLLHVVQMVHEGKSAETYAKNDVENGEFHVDLYTLPDGLVKDLWEFAVQKGAIAQAAH